MHGDNRSGQADSKQNIFCDQVEVQLVAFLKGGLSPAERRIITRHLSTCDRCALALRDLNTLEAELKVEANRYRPRLSPEASQRIQEQVYRRMRLSLVWQRMFQVVKTGFAFATFVVVVGVFAVFGYQWLQFMANPEPTPGAVIEVAPISAVVETAAPAIAPTSAPAERPSPTDLNESDPELSPPDFHVPIYWQQLASPMPGKAPHQITRSVVEAALAGETAVLSSHFVAMGESRQEPNLRMWGLFSRRCDEAVTVRDFSYRQLPTGESPMTAVYIYHNDRYTGEIKFRFINENWYPVYANPPFLNVCLKTRLIYP